jgi:voltage-gated potassium channel
VRENPEEHLLRTDARSPEDAAALHRFDGVMALPLVLSAVLPLILLPGSENFPVLAATVNIAAWIVFLVDFIEHERRLKHYLATWLGRFDLSVVILTAPWFVIFGPGNSKFVLLIRLARIARIVMAGSGLRRLFARIGRVAIVAAGVVFLGAAVAYYAEHPTNPEFATYRDSLWWGIVTLTTVGYGDIVPKTPTGRFAGVMIMITGIGILGVLAGSMASFFRIEPSTSTNDESPTPTNADPVLAEVIQLREQVARLADEIARLAAGPGAPTPEP